MKYKFNAYEFAQIDASVKFYDVPLFGDKAEEFLKLYDLFDINNITEEERKTRTIYRELDEYDIECICHIMRHIQNMFKDWVHGDHDDFYNYCALEYVINRLEREVENDN